MSGPVAALSRDGARLHLQHGPIDLIVTAEPLRREAAPRARRAAFAAAWARFQPLLGEIVAELDDLRAPSAGGLGAAGPGVPGRMRAAVAPHAAGGGAAAPQFVTPMAAVAGAVADEILAAMRAGADAAGAPLGRACVNNGGDAALHLAPGFAHRAEIRRLDGAPIGRLTLAAEDRPRGIATSGRGGRSLSLGIADSVTALAAGAAEADAAATLIANAVDLPGAPEIARAPARDVRADSDLGARRVVVSVAPLAPADRARALAAGSARADAMRAEGRIVAALLHLQGETRVLGTAGFAAGPAMLEAA
ncbi:MAG: UPF0280 family protein [Pseudomonadota bacterium]